MTKLSIVIATKNEAANIERCLQSVAWADEIVIVDDMSSDDTVARCKKFSAKIIRNDSKGSFHRNKNLGLKMATGEWLLSVDSDEVVSPELGREIRAAISDTDKLGFYIPRKNIFMNRWIKGCGWWPDRIIRLFRKNASKWPLEIHDTPKIEDHQRIGSLEQALIHHSYQDLSHYFAKFNLYTTQLAREERAKGVCLHWSNWPIYFFFKPLYWFGLKYIVRRGIRDGLPGFFISVASAWVIMATYFKLAEMQLMEGK
jgi:glycosyltransferase involved in cell wall biosynthesis